MSQKPPSFLKMIANFAKASAEYVAAGMPSVTTEQYEERVDICHNCPHLIEKTKQCGLCGCYIEDKASWQTGAFSAKSERIAHLNEKTRRKNERLANNKQ